MSQFKDLMCGLDDVEAYLIGYRRGHQAGIEQGLKLLNEHLDICARPLVVQAPAMFGGEPKESVERSCNRHVDCTIAEEEWLRKNPDYVRIGPNFHCHDEDCEDCFGQ